MTRAQYLALSTAAATLTLATGFAIGRQHSSTQPHHPLPTQYRAWRPPAVPPGAKAAGDIWYARDGGAILLWSPRACGPGWRTAVRADLARVPAAARAGAGAYRYSCPT